MIIEKVKKQFEDRLKRAKAYRLKHEAEWTVLTAYYHLKDPDHPNWKFDPLLADYADSIRARWIASIFAGRDFFDVGGRETNDTENAKWMSGLLKFQSEQEIRLPMVLKQGFIPMSYLGSQVFITSWDVAKNRPEVRGVSLWDVWFDPAGDRNGKFGWIIVHDRMQFGALKKLEANGKLMDIDQIKSSLDKKPDENTGYEPVRKAIGIDTVPEPNEGLEGEDDTRELDLYQMWTEDEVFIMEAKTGHIINVQTENPYKDREYHKIPVVLVRPLPEEGLIYGRSPVDRVVVNQSDKNEMRHTRRRISDLIIRGIWLIKRGLGFERDRLKKEAIAEADDISENAIRRLTIENVLPDIDRETTRIVQDADRHTNIYDPQRGGGEGDVTKTLGGLNLLIKEGNIIFAEQIASIQIEGIQTLIEHLVALNQENIDKQKVVMVTGKSVTIEPNQLLGNFDVIVKSSRMLGNEELEQKNIGLLQGKYAQDMEVNQRVMKEKEFEAYGLDPDEVLFPEEEVDIRVENQNLKNQMAQMQQQSQMQAMATQEKKPEPAPAPGGMV